MTEEFSHEQKLLRRSYQVDVSLREIELQNEIKTLKAKAKSFTALYERLKTDNFNYRKKLREQPKHVDAEKMRKLKIRLTSCNKKLEHLNRRLPTEIAEHQFLQKRIIQKYGAQAYLDLINHVDAPRRIDLKGITDFKKFYKIT